VRSSHAYEWIDKKNQNAFDSNVQIMAINPLNEITT
jgi:hypothetical protein